VLSFVCSVGNIPLAAVLWSGGISFGGVLAFLFADLIVIPILVIYRKYYGTRFTVRITMLMLVTMVLAALIVDGVFSAVGLIPAGPRPTRADIFSSIAINYKLALNLLGLTIFVGLFWLTARRGVTDPVCGMKVDRAKALSTALTGETHHFCSAECRTVFEAGFRHSTRQHRDGDGQAKSPRRPRGRGGERVPTPEQAREQPGRQAPRARDSKRDEQQDEVVIPEDR
jgi:YHS domain-containing protein